ncbi:MAG TPA: hypothetical protein V6D20_12560 [Candidatus Obscuribacterales bacterium]
MRPTNLSGLGWLVMVLLALPAQAHKTEVSGDVAGTWHLEPNHSPKAGEVARVWVALTQQGGRAIPLDQCDCQLAVYNTNQPEADPVLTPTLEAISPERFERIPGAEVIFPAVGEYRLVLTGSPTAEGSFTPFELSYTTVVAAGSVPEPSPPEVDTPSSEEAIAPLEQPEPVSDLPFWRLGAIAGAATTLLASLVLVGRKIGKH